MRNRLPRLIAGVVLVLSLAAMGMGAAWARASIRAGGQVLVLCSSGGPIQVTLDGNGKPTGQVHICPDLALGLVAAVSASHPDVQADADFDRIAFFTATRHRVDRALPRPSVRDPPFFSFESGC
ncbi:hypothetical protein LV82_01182 [Albidovulum inexpectatum]|uniref:Uncharacterized protein n=1 Tax=Albidovulum inexpectatum TaxID=196587 RepID=A0A2S5JI85_9RHOB|nr:hypothetical protein [Albidovulum inexpectatum]PPB81140.1 hypothetical protein LV82_01182 [Albidovulum inexpectatum]